MHLYVLNTCNSFVIKLRLYRLYNILSTLMTVLHELRSNKVVM